MGYDNAKGKRTLGNGQAGGKVALPIFETIMKAVWAQGTPQTPLPRPSPEAARHLIALPIDVNPASGSTAAAATRYDVRSGGSGSRASAAGSWNISGSTTAAASATPRSA